MKCFALWASLVLVIPPSVSGQSAPLSPGGEPVYLLNVPTSNPEATRASLASAGYDVDCLGAGPGHIEVVASLAEQQALVAAGFTPTITDTGTSLRTRLQSTDIPIGYHDLAAIEALLASTALSFPSIATVVDLSTTYGPGPTVENRTIKAIKISDNATQDEDEPNVLFAACHHCREIVTPEIALDIISRLTTGYGVDPQITGLVDSNEIWIIPVQNPDGLEYVWNTNNLWRKNRRPNPAGDFGVDLNRNYPLGWSASCAGSTQTTSETYRGPFVASEPETQTMIAFSRARRFAKVMDYHSTGREVLLSYVCTPIPASVQNWIDAEGVALSTLAGYGTRNPSAEGEHQIWQISEITSYAYLTETATNFQPTYALATTEAALVWPATLGFLARSPSLTGRITDMVTGLPVLTTVTVQGQNWQAGETRQNELRFGRYHDFLELGLQVITLSAPGYLPQTHSVTISAATTVLDVAMIAAPPAFELNFSTSGSGLGDLLLAINGIPAGTSEGYTVFSFTTPGPVGSGPLLGLTPDPVTFLSLTVPALPGSLLHWTYPAPGLFPAQSLSLPPGSVLLPQSSSTDAIAIAIGPSIAPAFTLVRRVTW